MDSLNNKDSRVFERFSARYPVRFKHTKDDFGTDVFLRDASAEGARFTTKQRIFINDCVSLLVQLPDGFSPLILSGRIVWTKPLASSLWEFGLRFHNVKLMEMQRIYGLANPNPA